MATEYSALFMGGTRHTASEKAVEPARPRYRLLMVDDDPSILAALRRVFQRENYELFFARSATEALRTLEEKEVHLVVSDHQMPGMTGTAFLARVRDRWPQVIRIMLTGHADTEAVMGAVKDGAVYRFILKPWNDDDLRLTIALALEQYELMARNRDLETRQQNGASSELEALAKLSVTNRSQLAILLHKKSLLTAAQIQQLHKELKSSRTSVIRLLMQRDWIDVARIYELLRDAMMFEEVDLREFQEDPKVLGLVPQAVCRRCLVLPLRVVDKRLRLAMADPMDMGLIEELGFSTGHTIHPVLADARQLDERISKIYGAGTADDLDGMLRAGHDPAEGIEIIIDDQESQETLEQLLRGSEDPPAVRVVNAILLEALRLGASDIHIHPRTKYVVVRYRIDGVLQDKIQIPQSLLSAVVSRIKIMSELDITERRRPQDGRITVKTPMRIVDLRISTLPTINGEKIVMRVLDRDSATQSVSDLGFSPSNLRRVLHVVAKPQGIILATGPTGSGKTTTLYALLQHEASTEKNYVTIEDPVEFHVDMAGQVPVRERIGLSFASVLRAILRQDPDVILLGEIRDHETAEVAFHAALTGHLVYSTLHTNSAAATIARLQDLGLKPHVLATALEAIIAQRLVRRICPHCSEGVTPDRDTLASLGPGFLQAGLSFRRGRGCVQCNRGYKGRAGLHEIMTLDDALRDAISHGAGAAEVSALARQAGMKTLIEDALEKAASGVTSVEEILRTLGPQSLSEGMT